MKKISLRIRMEKPLPNIKYHFIGKLDFEIDFTGLSSISQ
jgi:hypothetical protein